MIKEKHIPERKCLGCGEHFPKASLARVLKTPEGDIILDMTGRKNGRGAYICKNAECLKRARRQGRIERSLECKIPEELYLVLEEELRNE